MIYTAENIYQQCTYIWEFFGNLRDTLQPDPILTEQDGVQTHQFAAINGSIEVPDALIFKLKENGNFCATIPPYGPERGYFGNLEGFMRSGMKNEYIADLSRCLVDQLRVCARMHDMTARNVKAFPQQQPGFLSRLFGLSCPVRDSQEGATKMCVDSLHVLEQIATHILPSGNREHVSRDHLKKAVEKILSNNYAENTYSVSAMWNFGHILDILNRDHQGKDVSNAGL